MQCESERKRTPRRNEQPLIISLPRCYDDPCSRIVVLIELFAAAWSEVFRRMVTSTRVVRGQANPRAAFGAGSLPRATTALGSPLDACTCVPQDKGVWTL
jgi:hypothetical protein